jgi:hypothetical protein
MSETVVFRRLDQRFPPKRELLAIDPDGTFRMWRSGARIVGRFAGRVPDPDAFAALAEAAGAEAAPPGPQLPPDAVVDSVRVGGVTFSTAPWDQGGGPWGELVIACRGLLEQLLDQPDAAVALVLPRPAIARIEHRGNGVLPIELGAASVLVEAYGPSGRLAAAPAGVPGVAHVDAGPGWTLDVAIPVLEAPAGAQVLVRVTFVAQDDGVAVPVQLGVATTRAAG